MKAYVKYHMHEEIETHMKAGEVNFVFDNNGKL